MDSAVATARSILAFHRSVDLAVDGVPHAFDKDAPQGLQDWSGRPTFVCSPSATLTSAGRHGRFAMLCVESAMEDADQLLMVGRLRVAARETCDCCDGVREYVVVDLASVVLARGVQRIAVDVTAFADPALQLNAGYLRRCEQHVNSCHDNLLRDVVAQRLGSPAADIVAAQIVNLSLAGVELQWVTGEGAHRSRLIFETPATSAMQLGAQLRRSLHPDLC